MTRVRQDYLASALKVAAVLAACWGAAVFIDRAGDTVAYAQSSVYRIDSLKVRVDRLEKGSVATGYMTCVMFAETHPAPAVPVYCNQFTREQP